LTDPTPHPTHAAFGRFRLAGEIARANPQGLAARWRGAVASRFADDTAFHGHDGDRTVLRYPEVHYRWVDGAPAIFAIGAAAQRIMAHPWPGTTVLLGDEETRVLEVDWSALAVTRSFSRRLVRYELCAPWIALNQDNHARYRTLDRAARRDMLDRILVGNLLTMSQAFGWFFERDEIVYAAFEPTGEIPSTVKGVSLIGFTGTFVTNLVLPDGLAIGRSVSHGFGWFRRAPTSTPAAASDAAHGSAPPGSGADR
jgi:hypothetical protein